MCEWDNTKLVRLCESRRGSIYADVDECIADIVQALNDADIPTVASCCGHGKIHGSIVLKKEPVDIELVIRDFPYPYPKEDLRRNGKRDYESSTL